MLTAFQGRMKKHGNKCTVVLYPDGKHGWFNYGRADGSPFHETMTEVVKFLAKLGYLKSE
jgi:dienelactone hydrolase